MIIKVLPLIYKKQSSHDKIKEKVQNVFKKQKADEY